MLVPWPSSMLLWYYIIHCAVIHDCCVGAITGYWGWDVVKVRLLVRGWHYTAHALWATLTYRSLTEKARGNGLSTVNFPSLLSSECCFKMAFSTYLQIEIQQTLLCNRESMPSKRNRWEWFHEPTTLRHYAPDKYRVSGKNVDPKNLK